MTSLPQRSSLGAEGVGEIDDAQRPPFFVRDPCRLRPGRIAFARDFPFLPSLFERGVQLRPEGFQLLLMAGVNGVDLLVVGDCFQLDDCLEPLAA